MGASGDLELFLSGGVGPFAGHYNCVVGFTTQGTSWLIKWGVLSGVPSCHPRSFVLRGSNIGSAKSNIQLVI